MVPRWSVNNFAIDFAMLWRAVPMPDIMDEDEWDFSVILVNQKLWEW